MIVVAMRFLSGRYHATPWGRHVNEGIPEWPPSPWRLFRALVSSWKTVCSDIEQEQLEVLLAKLASSAPSFWLPPATAGHIRCYMPWFKKSFDDRTLIFDTFVALSKEDTLRFIWPEVTLEGKDKERLDRLLQGISYLGRAESWCELWLEEHPPPANCFPLTDDSLADPVQYDGIRVLTPEPASAILDRLLVETSELRSRQRRLNPHGSQWVTYARQRDALEIKPFLRKRSTAKKKSAYVAARFALDRYVLPTIQETVIVGEQSRSAAMGRYGRMFDGDVSPILSGKKSARPLQGHRHAFYLPTDEDRDGRIDHLTVYASGGLGEKECEALGMLNEVPWDNRTELKKMEEKRRLRVILLGFLQQNELVVCPSLFGPATKWSSTTPFVLTRFPKMYRDGRPKFNDRGEQIDGVEDQVRREWEMLRESNPALPNILSISVVPQLRLTAEQSIRWLSFQTQRQRGKGASSGFVYGLTLEFEKPLVGPLALGYGCHFGLGQFLPELE